MCYDFWGPAGEDASLSEHRATRKPAIVRSTSTLSSVPYWNPRNRPSKVSIIELNLSFILCIGYISTFVNTLGSQFFVEPVQCNQSFMLYMEYIRNNHMFYIMLFVSLIVIVT